MEHLLLSVAYITSAILFILSLRGLSSQVSARQGNLYGVAGMIIALVATTLTDAVQVYSILALGIGGGSVLGIVLARRVAMTAMPELVALLHSFVGAAAVLVGIASYLGDQGDHSRTILLVEIGIDVFIGSITFTGSIVAYLKLKGSLSGRALLLPARHVLNLTLVFACVALMVPFVKADGTSGLWALLGVTALASVLGVHLVAAIGGGDMPVVVSMLNSYSGWTASAAGFMLSNDLLIITGALVGSSGAILSAIMCKAMNRSIWSVIFGGFGTTPPAGSGAATVIEGSMQEISLDATVDALLAAREVVVVPGYGMAVARAQHAVHEMTRILGARKTRVRFAIHPVAGRLPGHMNVLLAEANVPYDLVLEMDEINEDLSKTDVVLVLGANDIVNPSAETDPSSPIAGMPVLRVWNAALTVVSKRGKSAGYAGVDNPLFYMDKTRMLFGDARERMEALVAALRSRITG